ATEPGKVEKCSEAYSTRVSGVYATKPGVLLTTESVDANLADHVPMGVIGIIPTKVSGENGPIAVGDLLVTSSTPGYAMKGDPDKLHFGNILGKAMEPFEKNGMGLIKVLVGKY
ncbi:MAG TPA: collagen-like protein, partial [Candidatus Kapabacteria bacterium]